MYLAWAFYLFYYMSNLQRCILCVTVAFTFSFSSVNFDSFSTLELGSLNIILHRMFLKQKVLVSGISGKEIHQNYELLSWHMTYHVSSMPSRYTVSWNNNLIATLLVLTVIFGPQASSAIQSYFVWWNLNLLSLKERTTDSRAHACIIVSITSLTLYFISSSYNIKN